MEVVERIYESCIPIIFATDKNFIPYLNVAIQSLVDNSSDSSNYDIVILCTDVEEYKQNQFKKLERENVSIRFYDMAYLMSQYKDVWYTHWNYTDAMYYRFFIPQLFKCYEKVLYLDCDIVVNCDIAELYNIDMNGKALAASIGLARQHEDDFHRNYIENTLNIKKEQYFNSGVLILDLNKINSSTFFELCIDTLKRIKEPLFPDQDVLNLIFLNDKLCLSCTYNFTWNVIHYYKDSENKLSTDFREDFIEACCNPKIIHYAGKYKPWQSPELSYADYFWKYARKTQFYEEIIYKNCQTNMWRKSIYNVVYRKRIYLKYLRCKLLKLITFGEKREHYSSKARYLKGMVRDYRKTLNK